MPCDSCYSLTRANQALAIVFAIVNAGTSSVSSLTSISPSVIAREAFHSLRVYAICPDKTRRLFSIGVFIMEMVPAAVDIVSFVSKHRGHISQCS